MLPLYMIKYITGPSTPLRSPDAFFAPSSRPRPRRAGNRAVPKERKYMALAFIYCGDATDTCPRTRATLAVGFSADRTECTQLIKRVLLGLPAPSLLFSPWPHSSPSTESKPVARDAIHFSNTPSAMEDIEKALDDLIQLAKPPSRVAPPEDVLHKLIVEHLKAWKQELLAHLKPQAPASEVTRKPFYTFFKGRSPAFERAYISYEEFAKKIRAYNAWLWDGLSNNRALHYDVYTALVGLGFLSKRLGQR